VIVWPSCDENKPLDGLFPLDIRRPVLGENFLGGTVNQYKDFIGGVTIKRVVRTVELMHFLPKLRDPHFELLLLRSCISIDNFFRKSQPIHMEDATILVWWKSFIGDL
jgi:hypothetical protein